MSVSRRFPAPGEVPEPASERRRHARVGLAMFAAFLVLTAIVTGAGVLLLVAR